MSDLPPPAPVTSISVVVPARNEAGLIGRALAAVEASAQYLHAHSREPVSVNTLVVLDSCIDHTPVVVRGFAVDTIVVEYGSAGAARHAGVDAVLQRSGSIGTHWIANTDADSVVPPEWLATHIRTANAGADLLVGLVRPDEADITVPQRDRWRRAHRVAAGHRHVFGANLGIRASAYRALGGFAAREVGEDRILVDAAENAGMRIVRTDQAVVLTSGRRDARAPGGFANWLHSP